MSRTSRGHVSPHDAVTPPGIRPELDRDGSLLINSAICLIWSRHMLREPSGPLCGNTRIGQDRRWVLQSVFSDEISTLLEESAKNDLC